MIGQIIHGFRITDEIGTGDTGTVYRGTEMDSGHEVAVKLIPLQNASDNAFNVHFDNAAQQITQLDHINIARLIQHWQTADEAFVVTRYIRGGSVRDLLADKGALPLSTTLRLLEQIAGALHYAHEHNVIHRNLKPENILMDVRGNAYLTDFAIGQSGAATTQTDMHAFGRILYEMLAGESPSTETIPAITDKRPELPQQLNTLIARCTTQNPAQHYASFAAISDEMRSILYSNDATTTQVASGDKNRQIMLQNMRQFWIEGMLENSLTNSLIDLSLMTNTDVVDQPWDAVIRTDSDGGEITVQANSLLEVFDQSNGKLLILGAPGSGKTTMLLQLLQDLLARAESDPEYLIPVVVNLSTWGELMRPIDQWLRSRLIDQYYVPENVAEAWIADEKLLILLDGLDEVEESKRRQCSRAINNFRRNYSYADVVVTSRTTEYLDLADQLVLNAVIQISPLGDGAIFGYLDNFPGESVDALTTALRGDDQMRELCRSPFLLVTMAIAYRDLSAADIGDFDTLEGRRKHLFAAYIKRMVTLNADTLAYDDGDFRDYLSYVAYHMVDRSMTVFAVESPQPFWLDDNEKFGVLRASTIAYFALFALLFVISLIVTPNYLYPFLILLATILQWGTDVGAQGITLSGSFKFALSIIDGLAILAVFGIAWYVLSLPESVLMSILLGMLLGFKTSGDVTVQQNITPGDAVRRNYAVVLTVFALSLIIGAGVGVFVLGVPQGIIVALMFATLIAVAKTNVRGIILFYALRLHLMRQKRLPLQLKHFLENAVSLLMVRRIGGSYIFIHRYLLEYFAERYQTGR